LNSYLFLSSLSISLSSGPGKLHLDGRPLKAATIERADYDPYPDPTSRRQNFLLRFVLKEGRNRQIRRMCEAIGTKVINLQRVRIGKIGLGSLGLGKWRILRHDEEF
jgi:23S rRNA pseudouridine2604 synthase